MENKPAIQEANNQVISNFFTDYGQETKGKLSAFLFELSLLVILDHAELPTDTSAAAHMTIKFRALHDLVNGLQDPRT